MWEKPKNASTKTPETLRIEIPELPVDLAAVDEAASNTAQAASESVPGATADTPMSK
jgi:hypothetical protein